MRYGDVIKLVHSTIEYDEIGNSIPKKTERTVFANRYQVSESEFYSSNINYKGSQHTIRPKSAFQIRTIEYNNEQQYIYNGILFDIVRVSNKGDFSLIVGVETIHENKNQA